jgi:hypothetical protein
MKVMKKILTMTALSAGMLAVAACGKKEDYVVPEDLQSDLNQTLTESLGVPESCDITLKIKGKSPGEISINDDSIHVPDAYSMSRYTFDTYELSPDKAKEIVEGLFDDQSAVYVREDEDEMTKEELEAAIKEVSDTIDAYDEAGEDSSYFQSELKEYKEKLKSAPDKLELNTDYDNPYKIYEGNYDGRKYKLTFSKGVDRDYSDDANGEGVYMEFGMASDEKDKIVKSVDGATWYNCVDVNLAADKDMINNLDNEAEISEQDAINEAMNLVSTLGLKGMECEDVSDCYKYWWGKDGAINPSLDGYVVKLRRSLDGEFAYYCGYGYVDNIVSEKDVISFSEYLNVYVDDDGIISFAGFIFADSDTIEKTDVNLISYDSVIDDIEKEAGSYYKKYHSSYNKISFNDFSLTYVVERDKDGTTYFEPTWVAIYREESSGGVEVDSEAFMLDAVSGEYVDILVQLERLGLCD